MGCSCNALPWGNSMQGSRQCRASSTAAGRGGAIPTAAPPPPQARAAGAGTILLRLHACHAQHGRRQRTARHHTPHGSAPSSTHPLPQGDLRVVIFSTRVGMRTGPLTCGGWMRVGHRTHEMHLLCRQQQPGCGGGGTQRQAARQRPTASRAVPYGCQACPLLSRAATAAGWGTAAVAAAAFRPIKLCWPHLELLLLGAAHQVRAHLLQVLHLQECIMCASDGD